MTGLRPPTRSSTNLRQLDGLSQTINHLPSATACAATARLVRSFFDQPLGTQLSDVKAV
jgi:hypothetical protein